MGLYMGHSTFLTKWGREMAQFCWKISKKYIFLFKGNKCCHVIWFGIEGHFGVQNKKEYFTIFNRITLQFRHLLDKKDSNFLDNCNTNLAIVVETRWTTRWLLRHRYRTDFSDLHGLATFDLVSTNWYVWSRDSRWMSYETAAILNQNLPYIPHIIG